MLQVTVWSQVKSWRTPKNRPEQEEEEINLELLHLEFEVVQMRRMLKGREPVRMLLPA